MATTQATTATRGEHRKCIVQSKYISIVEAGLKKKAQIARQIAQTLVKMDYVDKWIFRKEAIDH